MSVIQRNYWTCDLCGAQAVEEEPVEAWDDPVVSPVEGWITDLDVPPEYRDHPCMNIVDACPACQVNPDFTQYVENWKRKQDACNHDEGWPNYMIEGESAVKRCSKCSAVVEIADRSAKR